MNRLLPPVPWIRRLVVAALAIALLLAALPEAIRWGTVRWLDRHGVAATIDDIDLNLFTARAAVEGVRLGDPALVVTRLAVAGSWRDLIHRRLRLERVEVDGVKVNAVRDAEGGWRIAGQPLPAPAAAQGEEEAAAGPPWGLGVDAVEIRDLQLHYRDPQAAHEIALHHLHFGTVATWAPEQATPVGLAATVDGGRLAVEGEVTPFAAAPGVRLAVDLDGFPLQRVAPAVAAVTRLEGGLTTHLQLSARQAPDGLAATVTGEATVASVVVRPAAVAATATAERFGWKGQVTVGPKAAVAVQGDVAARDLRLTPADDKQPPLSLAEVALTGIDVAGPHHLAAGHLRLAGLELTLVREADGTLSLLNALKPAGGGAAPPAAKEGPAAPAAQTGPLALRLGGVELAGESRIQFTDRSVDPPFTFTLAPVALTLGALDTAHPEAATPFHLTAQPGPYATLAAEGTVAPLAPQVAADAEAKLAAIDLAPLTGYTARAVGYRLKSGHLDADLTIKVAAGRLDAQTTWQANKLEMERLSQGGKDPLSDSLGIPVNTALSLLRDRHDDIHLEVPVTGPLAEAKVGLGSALRQVAAKATVKAVQTAVLHYLAPLSSPLGLALAAGKLVNLATALRFDPIPFEAGATALPEAATPYLDRLATRLTDRPRVRLTLCGIATRADLVEAAPPAGKSRSAAAPPPAPSTAVGSVDEPEPSPSTGGRPTAAAGEAAAVPSLTEAQRATLRDLSTARGAAVKAALVARGIAADRLFTCSPAVEVDPDAKPRVELSL